MKMFSVTVFAQQWVETMVEIEADDAEQAKRMAFARVQKEPGAFVFVPTDSPEVLSHAEINREYRAI